jgi:hypothetical protein
MRPVKATRFGGRDVVATLTGRLRRSVMIRRLNG